MGNKSASHSKFFYINRSDVDTYIASETINANDIILTKDTHEILFVNSGLEIVSTVSRQHIYDGVDVAEGKLNESTDSYDGQLVSIKQDDAYKPYIVNKDNDGYYVTPIDINSIKSVSINNRDLLFYNSSEQTQDTLVYTIEIPETDLSEVENAIAVLNGASDTRGSVRWIVDQSNADLKNGIFELKNTKADNLTLDGNILKLKSGDDELSRVSLSATGGGNLYWESFGG